MRSVASVDKVAASKTWKLLDFLTMYQQKQYMLHIVGARGTRNKQNHDKDDGDEPIGEAYYNEEPNLRRIQKLKDLWLILMTQMKGKFFTLAVSHHLSCSKCCAN